LLSKEGFICGDKLLGCAILNDEKDDNLTDTCYECINKDTDLSSSNNKICVEND